jgi:hypothetical protein
MGIKVCLPGWFGRPFKPEGFSCRWKFIGVRFQKELMKKRIHGGKYMEVEIYGKWFAERRRTGLAQIQDDVVTHSKAHVVCYEGKS